MRWLVALTLFVWVLPGSASATEIKLLVTNAFQSVISQIAPLFQAQTGHTLSIRSAASGALQNEILRGDQFDVVIMIASNMDAVEKAGKIAPGSRSKIARAGLGMAVRKGQPKPDISTVEKFRQALVNARSVAYVTGGVSGQHLIAVTERLGIGDQVKAKGKTLPSGNVAELVEKGEAEVAIQQMSELMAVKGVDVVGELPADIDLISQIDAAASADTANPDATKAFIELLTNREGKNVIKARGMIPG